SRARRRKEVPDARRVLFAHDRDGTRERFANPLHMRVRCIRWDVIHGEVVHSVGLVAGYWDTTLDPAFEVEHELARLWLPVEARETDDLDLEAHLLARFAYRGVPR